MTIHDERRRRRAEYFGLVEVPDKVSASSKKADLLAAAEAQGLDVDESMTKAELLEVLED